MSLPHFFLYLDNKLLIKLSEYSILTFIFIECSENLEQMNT